MSVRLAKEIDTKRIVDLLEKYHERSNIADIPFDRKVMSNAVRYYIAMPKHAVFVYESGGEIEGALAVSLEPFMFNEKKYWATDLFNVANKGGTQLMWKFFEWVKLFKNVERIYLGVSSGRQRTNRLYEALGMEQVGGFYQKTVSGD